MHFLYTSAVFSFFLVSRISASQNSVNTTAENPLIIAVPARPFSSKFVQIDPASDGKRYTGFSVRVFEEAQKLLGYKIYYEFVAVSGPYDDLVASVANKTFDAAVGDIAIIARRWRLVDFTVPYAESGLTMVVRVKDSEPWMFLKPFTPELWLATGGIMLYTMIVVWFLEQRSNPDFGGSWHHQLGNATWFAFTSLLSAHRDNVKSNHTRVVIVVWLFLVLIITQSFTASLTSWLTIKRLHPSVDLLRTKDAKVGCTPFMKRFVENEIGYKSEDIKLLPLEGDYPDAFKRGTITAAFLGISYAKILVNGHCKDYTITGSSYRFGGLSFAFQKGSQLASDLSEAILKLSENGMLKRLETSWLAPSSECSVDSQADQDTDSLTFKSFWGLYLFSATITTTSLISFVVRLLKNYKRRQLETNNVAEDDDGSVRIKTVRVLRYLKNGKLESGGSATGSIRVAPEIQI